MYEGGGILMENATTDGFSTIKQRTESILCLSGQNQGCSVNDRCCECAITCDTEKSVDNLSLKLEKLSTSSASHIAEVATTLLDLNADIRKVFTNQILSREMLQKYIVTTFKTIVKIPVLSLLEDVTNHIVDILDLIKTDLRNLTDARNIETKNSVAIELGKHVIMLADVTARLAKVMSGVCNLPDIVVEEVYSVILATTVVFVFSTQTLIMNAKQVNQVGFRNDAASNICLQMSLALQQYVLLIQRICVCQTVRSLKELLPTIESSLFEISTKLRDGIGLATGDPQSLIGSAEGIMICVRSNKLLQESEAAISDVIVSMFDVSDAILAGSLSCSCINGFDQTVSIQLRKILVHVHATFFLIANTPDDGFSSGDKLSMLLATMNGIVDKIMCVTDDVIQSILSLGDITEGSSSLIRLFEATVSIATSIVTTVALIFSELKGGSNSIDLPRALPHIMMIAKHEMSAAGDRLKQTSNDCANDNLKYQEETFMETSLAIHSFMELKNDIVDTVSKLDCNKIVGNAGISNVGIFVGQIRSATQRYSQHSSFGKVIAGAVTDILNDVHGTLDRLSTVSLEKRHMLQLSWQTISNYYLALVTLNSVFNSSRYGTTVSLF